MAARANTILVQGAGGDIPDADPGTGAPSITTYDMVIADLGVLPTTGNNVTLSLIGFLHPYAGALIVSLTNLNSGVTRDVFNQPGVGAPSNDTCLNSTVLGYCANFGDNYDFNGNYSGDLWTTAAALGDADFIPGGQYFPVTAGGAPSLLSSAFNSPSDQTLLPVAGTWRLTITNFFPGPDDPFATFTGWQLAVVVNGVANDVPEPSYGVVLLVLAAAVLAGQRLTV